MQNTHGGNSEGELGHGVKGVRASVDQLLNELGNLGSGSPLLTQTLDLLVGGYFSSEEQPEERFGQWL